jgi:hypothetical protein
MSRRKALSFIKTFHRGKWPRKLQKRPEAKEVFSSVLFLSFTHCTLISLALKS